MKTKQATSDQTSDESKRLIFADDLKSNIADLEAVGGNRYYRAGFNDSLRNLIPDVIDEQPTVDAIPVSAEEVKHLINDTLAYIWKMESDGRENLTDSRKTLLEKLKRFEKEHFLDIACSYGERRTDG